jgi:hypothetical protein
MKNKEFVLNKPALNQLGLVVSAIVLGAALPGVGHAAPIDVGNPDIKVRWDNTVRLNYVHRVESQDKNTLAQVNADDGNRNFDKGTVSTRLDNLSEFDFVYKRNHGFRVTAAGWYDRAYDRSLDNKSVGTSNHINSSGNQALGLSSETKRFYRGPSAEFLDAFVFTRFKIGGINTDVRAGSHVVYWGESLMGNGIMHGITYGQTGLDLAKAVAVPGVEAKELFRPLNQISMQIRPSAELSIALQYMLEWEAFRLPEAGSFLGTTDMLSLGGEGLILGPGVVARRAHDATPDDRGEWGVAARWSPSWAKNGTIGFYYRNFADKLPQVFLTGGGANYHLAYGDNIDLYGLSFTQQIYGISVGAEISYRDNMPLVSDVTALAAMPRDGSVPGARGKTWHGLVNLIGTRPANALWDSLGWSAELTWMHVDKVTDNAHLYKGRSGYDGLDKPDDTYVALALNLNPTYFQVMNGVDMYLPFSVSYGVHGNAATTSAGNEGAGNYSLGVGLDVHSRYRFDLRYTDYLGRNKVNDAGNRVYNGGNSLLTDRGNVSLTFKTTF